MNKLPTEILIDIIAKLDGLSKLSRVSKFYNRFMSENKIPICFEFASKIWFRIKRDESYILYKFYKENSLEFEYVYEDYSGLFEAVIEASKFGNFEIVRFYVDKYSNSCGCFTLMNIGKILLNSAKNGHTKNIKYIHDNVEEFDIIFTDIDYDNIRYDHIADELLVHAVKACHEETILYLIEIGADIYVKGDDGYCILDDDESFNYIVKIKLKMQ